MAQNKGASAEADRATHERSRVAPSPPTVRIPSATCAVCDSEQHMQRCLGAGGLNDACLGCFYIWYDGLGPCDRAEHGHRVPHIHGEDIRAYSLKAKVAGTWPFDGCQLPVADDAEKQRAASAIEAATAGETVKLGSTEGESAVGATGAETPTLSSPRRG